MKKRYIFYIIIALGLAWLVYYRVNENKKITGGGQAMRGGAGAGMAVQGIIADYSNFDNTLEVTGSIEPNESVELHGEVSGIVTGIHFQEGSFVEKGKLLVKINDADIQAQLQQAKTKETLSASNESRAKQLLAKGAISQEEYDVALADLSTLKSQTTIIKTQLAKTSIVAPFSGKIGLRAISVGEYLTPAKSIAKLSNTNPVKVSFSVPEKYTSQIKLGSAIKFTVDGTDKDFTGKVYALEPGINTTTRTLEIRALADNPNNVLLPGAFAKISLSLNTVNDAILVPNEAVIPVMQGKIVYVSKNGKATQVPVEAGTRGASTIVITSGLSKGDTVLTTGAMTLKEGTAVKVNIVKNQE